MFYSYKKKFFNITNTKLPITVFLIFFFFNHIYTQEWQFIGLENENINCIELDPQNPMTIYAGSLSNFSENKTGGLFKSTNGGVYWDTLLYNATVIDIDIDPQKSNIIFASLAQNFLTHPGILKSIDGGDNWFHADSGINLSLEEGIRTLVIHPRNHDLLFAGTGGNYGGDLYMSINGGLHWNQIGVDSLNSVVSLAIDPVNPLNMYMGEGGNGYLMKSINGGTDWRIVLTGDDIVKAQDIKVNPKKSNIVYVGSYGNGFFISADYGETWSSANNNLPLKNWILDISLSYDKIFIAANGDSGIALYESSHDSINWHVVGNRYFGDLVRAVTYDPQNKFLYAGSFGIYKYQFLTDIDHKENILNAISSKVNYYPNPTNNYICFQYSTKFNEMVIIEIYNLLGQKVKMVNKGVLYPGIHNFVVNCNMFPTGVYICKIITNNSVYVDKFIIIK